MESRKNFYTYIKIEENIQENFSKKRSLVTLFSERNISL